MTWAQALASTALLASAVAVILILVKEATHQGAPPMALFVAVGSMSIIAHATDLLIGVVIMAVRASRARRVHGCGLLERKNR